jgi:Protein of unknown function (DUF1592)/Protein of unknown function (DUF1588)/Protein of unknown function (DUF1595)/Protein of unknown function (DUF1585)/Protein of unknown function (DUF1587)
MAWLPPGPIAVLALAGAAALGCEAEIAGQPVSGPNPSGGSAAGTGGAVAVAPGASRFLRDTEAQPTPMRRLTRVEYGNIVHELLGVAAPASALLPDDSLSSGFASTAGQLMTIASASRYLDAASDVSTRLEPNVGALVPCTVTGDVAAEAGCVDAFLSATGSRLFRRPISEAEKARYLAAFKASRASESYERSASLVVEALLVAPEFLFVEEPSGGPVGTRHTLDSWQVASRLSLLLWDSVPDAPLLGLAQAGGLLAGPAVAEQVERMLPDERAKLPIRSFFDDWLELAKIENVTRDALAYPTVTPALLADLAQESRQFVDQVFWQDNDFRKLFVSPARYRNQALSAFYGDALGQSASIARVDAEISEHSFGLLSQAGVLMTLAQSQKTAAIHRGVFLRRKLLCEALPPPPPGLATPLPEITAGVSSRERITEHTSAPVCAGCHVRINPLGFTLDHFDIAGQWREQDQDLPIDARGNITDAGFLADVDGARALSEQLAQSPNARACVAQQLFTFTFGRKPAQSDAAMFDAISQKFEASGFSLKTLVTELATSDDFRARIEPAQVMP